MDRKAQSSKYCTSPRQLLRVAFEQAWCNIERSDRLDRRKLKDGWEWLKSRKDCCWVWFLSKTDWGLQRVLRITLLELTSHPMTSTALTNDFSLLHPWLSKPSSCILRRSSLAFKAIGTGGPTLWGSLQYIQYCILSGPGDATYELGVTVQYI